MNKKYCYWWVINKACVSPFVTDHCCFHKPDAVIMINGLYEIYEMIRINFMDIPIVINIWTYTTGYLLSFSLFNDPVISDFFANGGM